MGLIERYEVISSGWSWLICQVNGHCGWAWIFLVGSIHTSEAWPNYFGCEPQSEEYYTQVRYWTPDNSGRGTCNWKVKWKWLLEEITWKVNDQCWYLLLNFRRLQVITSWLVEADWSPNLRCQNDVWAKVGVGPWCKQVCTAWRINACWCCLTWDFVDCSYIWGFEWHWCHVLLYSQCLPAGASIVEAPNYLWSWVCTRERWKSSFDQTIIVWRKVLQKIFPEPSLGMHITSGIRPLPCWSWCMSEACT